MSTKPKILVTAAAGHTGSATVFQLRDIRDLRKPMAGVQRAYPCPPVSPNILHNTMLFAVGSASGQLSLAARRNST